jgi:CheY-like chemotaxis protein
MEKQPALSATLTRQLEMIKRNVELEARLIDDLLDVTRISHGKLSLARDVVDAHALIEDVGGRCQAEFDAAGIASVVDLGAGLHHVEADPTRLREIVWNLVRNAIQHTPRGQVTIRSRNDPSQGFELAITDSGSGMDSATLAAVFTPFMQGENRRTRGGGLGLGLAICKGLVEAHGGHIVAHSAGPGQGSTFVVRLGTVIPPAAQQEEKQQQAQLQLRGAGRTVLLVEDDTDNASAIADVLRIHGYAVRVGGTVAEGLVLADEGFDVLVSDIGLPDGTGRDLMRQLSTRKPVKGIALTGYGMERDIERDKEAGFTRHITKPVEPTELLAAIDELAQKRRYGT